jgi:hypothetical protein
MRKIYEIKNKQIENKKVYGIGAKNGIFLSVSYINKLTT